MFVLFSFRALRLPRWLAGVAAILVLAPAGALGTDYHLDAERGLDSQDGRTPETAWRTVARANATTYAPGDRIRFKRGGVWSGPGFRARGSGTVTAPIVLEDYGDPGQARPIVDGVGPHEPAVLLQNVQHWVVRHLELTQHGQAPQALDPNNEKGKDADQHSDEYMRAVVHVLGLGPPGVPDCGEGCTTRNIRLENLVVRDGSWNGIYASGGYYQLRADTYGVVDGLVIQNVESRGHHKSGIEITCTYFKTRTYAASNVLVLDCYLHDNGGDGAMVGPVRNALLEGNECAYNGQLRNARVGCWTWDSENTVIQFNESHHNRTPLTDGRARDGAGFDLDLGTENGVIQYNWSHDNEGEGFLLLAYPIGFGYERGQSRNLLLRYNLGERDGRKLAGGITLFGGVAPAVIHNNTIYYEPDRSAGTEMFNGEGGAVTSSIFGRSGRPDARFYNNLFIINGRANPSAVANSAWSDGSGTFTFENNLWWHVDGAARFDWGGSIPLAWADWRSAGFDLQGLNTDPRLAGPLGTGPAAYKPGPASAGIDRGRLVLDPLRGMGSQDAFGAFMPQGAAPDLGAFEYRTGQPDPGAAWLLPPARQPDGSWRVEFTGMAGRSYLVQFTDALGSWTSRGRPTESAPGRFTFLDSGTTARRVFQAVTRGVPGLGSGPRPGPNR